MGPALMPVGRVPAGEIEAAVIDQMRAVVFRQPEIVAGTWKAGRVHADNITEADARAALQQLDPLWDELFPAEQARIVALLVERVDIGTDGLNVRLRMDGSAGCARDAGRRHGRSRMTRATPIPDTVTLQVPFRVVKHGGRKEVQLPDGATQPRRTDNALVKALARAFRWKRMLESGEFTTIAELADREGIAPSYMTRILRLTLLAPDIVEAILDGKQGPEVTLARVLGPHPVEWAAQPDHFEKKILRCAGSAEASALGVGDRRRPKSCEPPGQRPCRFSGPLVGRACSLFAAIIRRREAMGGRSHQVLKRLRPLRLSKERAPNSSGV